MFDDANEAETEVVKVYIERILWLLCRINVSVNVLVLDIEFPVVELELLASDRLLRVPVGNAPCRCYDSDRRSGDL